MPNCKNCGTSLPDGAPACPACGAPAPVENAPVAPAAETAAPGAATAAPVTATSETVAPVTAPAAETAPAAPATAASMTPAAPENTGPAAPAAPASAPPAAGGVSLAQMFAAPGDATPPAPAPAGQAPHGTPAPVQAPSVPGQPAAPGQVPPAYGQPGQPAAYGQPPQSAIPGQVSPAYSQPPQQPYPGQPMYGVPAPGQVPPPQPQKPKKNTGLIIGLSVGGGALLIVILVCLLLFFNRTPGTTGKPAATGGTSITDASTAGKPVAGGAIFSASDAEALAALRAGLTTTKPVLLKNYNDSSNCSFLLPDGVTMVEAGGEVNDSTCTPDGTTFAYTIWEDDYTYTLYLYQNGAATQIAENVDEYYLAPISQNLYYTVTDADYTTSLFLYANGSESLLAKDADTFVVSSNEQYVLYSTYDSIYRLSAGGDAVKVYDEGAYVLFSVSNDGSLALFRIRDYAAEAEVVHALQMDPATGETIADDTINMDDEYMLILVYTCYDGSQAVLSTEGGLWRYTPETGFAQLYTGGNAVCMPCTKTDYFYSTNGITCYVENMDTVLFAGLDDERTGTLYLQGPGDADPQELQSDISADMYSSDIFVNTDLTAVAYLSGEELYIATIADGAATAGDPFATGVDAIAFSADLANGYYSIDGTLYHTQNGGEGKLVSDDCYSARTSADGSYCVITGYEGCFVYHDGTLTPAVDDTYGYPDIIANEGWFIYTAYGDDGLERVLYTPDGETTNLGDVGLYELESI